jgi:hypothetical protein
MARLHLAQLEARADGRFPAAIAWTDDDGLPPAPEIGFIGRTGGIAVAMFDSFGHCLSLAPGPTVGPSGAELRRSPAKEQHQRAGARYRRAGGGAPSPFRLARCHAQFPFPVNGAEKKGFHGHRNPLRFGSLSPQTKMRRHASRTHRT